MNETLFYELSKMDQLNFIKKSSQFIKRAISKNFFKCYNSKRIIFNDCEANVTKITFDYVSKNILVVKVHSFCRYYLISQ